MKRENRDPENEAIEIRLLLEAIYLKYGYDFRSYAKSSIKRRIRHRLHESGLSNISEMQHKILSETSYFETLLLDFSINVTAMFRDPHFYLAVRKEVVPILRDYDHIKIWHAGCATGEEVYSMAILLKEEGLYDRTNIYATDMNEIVVRRAKNGVFRIDQIQEYTRNYQLSGGVESFADYYTADSESVIMSQSLKSNVVFADHNLATDGIFGEMNVVVCRNVLIYFSRDLQNRVFDLFRDSLCPGGFLCLGTRESVRFSDASEAFEGVCEREKIYRKGGVTGNDDRPQLEKEAEGCRPN